MATLQQRTQTTSDRIDSLSDGQITLYKNLKDKQNKTPEEQGTYFALERYIKGMTNRFPPAVEEPMDIRPDWAKQQDYGVPRPRPQPTSPLDHPAVQGALHYAQMDNQGRVAGLDEELENVETPQFGNLLSGGPRRQSNRLDSPLLIDKQQNQPQELPMVGAQDLLSQPNPQNIPPQSGLGMSPIQPQIPPQSGLGMDPVIQGANTPGPIQMQPDQMAPPIQEQYLPPAWYNENPGPLLSFNPNPTSLPQNPQQFDNFQPQAPVQPQIPPQSGGTQPIQPYQDQDQLQQSYGAPEGYTSLLDEFKRTKQNEVQELPMLGVEDARVSAWGQPQNPNRFDNFQPQAVTPPSLAEIRARSGYMVPDYALKPRVQNPLQFDNFNPNVVQPTKRWGNLQGLQTENLNDLENDKLLAAAQWLWNALQGAQ